MASQIETLLNTIATAIYGRDMRSAIHDSIEMCYTDVSTGKTTAETAAASANSAATAANTATTNANAATTAANTAASNANTKATAANNAASAANTAAASANEATSAAEEATTDTVNAIATARTAATNANNAASSATSAATAAQNATTAANTATTNANAATSSANSAASAATTATSKANTATSKANTATANANTATASANAAAESANDAASAAADAATSANNAASAANTARTNADNATTAANSAAASATNAANDANTAASNAITATNNATTATTSANSAATRANSAADTIEYLTVDAEDAPYTTQASAEVSIRNAHKHIHFVLRQGVPGPGFVIKGNAYASVADLEAAITDPEIGDMYNVGTAYPYLAYRWTGTQWENQGPIGNSITQITTNEVQAIQNGSTLPEDNTKALGIAGLTYYIQTIQAALFDRKVDKISGKGLSTNDFTDGYKDGVDNNTAQISTLASTKVDKVSGKGLSTNDFTTAYKDLIDALNTSVSSLNTDKANKTETVSNVAYNSSSKKFTKTINGTTTDIVTVATLKTALALTTSALPQVDGTASAGSATTFSRSDHVHPTDTTRQAANTYINGSEAKTVAINDWVSDSTYTDYPYKANIAVSGVTSSMYAEVIFNPDDAASGNFATICYTGTDIITIYANSVPDSAINIPNIVIMK